MICHSFSSLVDLLRCRAEERADGAAFTFLVNGETEGETWTWGDLDRRSREVAARLQCRLQPGERALLLYPPGLDFLSAFFGCLCSGVVAVPTFPPHPVKPSPALPRLQAIAAEADVHLILCSTALAERAPALFRDAPALARVPLLATDGLEVPSLPAWRPPDVVPDTLAFLQYTSGSTAAPKGVMVSHGNLLSNLASILERFPMDAGSRSVSWLPAHHDMGLIGGILLPLFVGCPAYLMAPVSFVQKPLRWLAAVSRYRATISGGPNFAYDYCAARVSPEERRGLDLSCWRGAYNGSEPIRRSTMDGFSAAFAPCGFRRSAFHPVYGLAEATLLVSSAQLTDNPDADPHDAVVSCGRSAPGTRVVVVDPQRRTPLPPGEVGEVWMDGPGVARGYWGRQEETEQTFAAHLADSGDGPFLRTGDLGFVRGGELFVTGRIKDVIIIRGRKHYPQDLEHTVESSHPAVRPGGAAALSLPGEEGERLLIVAEIDPRQRSRPPGPDECLEELMGTIRQAVAERHELQTYAVLIVPAGGIPRTSSGKLRRQACRQGVLDGGLRPLAQWRQRPAHPEPASRRPRP